MCVNTLQDRNKATGSLSLVLFGDLDCQAGSGAANPASARETAGEVGWYARVPILLRHAEHRADPHHRQGIQTDPPPAFDLMIITATS
jgi:hypothetical protein